MKIIRFRCILESSCFRLITLYPHEIQVHSYSYGSNVIREQCLHCLVYFLLIRFQLIPFTINVFIELNLILS